MINKLIRSIFKRKTYSASELLENWAIDDNLTSEERDRAIRIQYLRYNDSDFASLEVRLRFGDKPTKEDREKYGELIDYL